MATEITVDETTLNVTVTVSNERGPAGANGPNSVTSATTSDGTADLSVHGIQASDEIGAASLYGTDINGINLAVDNATLGTASVLGTLTAEHIHGNLAGSLYMHVRAGENLSKGDPVYVSGSHGSGATMIPIVSRADASDLAKMPAIAIMDAAVAANANGHAVISGTITDFNTNAYTVNSTLYVANGGGLTATKPTNVQPVARVERVNTNNGGIVVKVNGLYSDISPANIGAVATTDPRLSDARPTTAAFIDTALQSATVAQEGSIRQSIHASELRGIDRLANYRNAIENSGTLARSNILFFGDSMIGTAQTALESAINSASRISGRGFLPGAPGGGATIEFDACIKWVNGQTFRLDSAGEFVEFAIAGTFAFPATQMKVYHLRQPGGGTYKIQLSTNGGAFTDEAGFTSINTDGATAGVVNTITKTAYETTYRIRVVWVSGVVNIIGAGYRDAGRFGPIVSFITNGSTSINNLDASSLTSRAITDPIFADIAPNLMVLSHLDGAITVTGFQATFQNNITAGIVSAGAPAPSWLVIGPPIGSTELADADRAAQQSAQMTLAASRGDAFWDNRTWAMPVSTVISRGLLTVGDPTHYSELAQRAWVTEMFSHFNLLRSPGQTAGTFASIKILGGGLFESTPVSSASYNGNETSHEGSFRLRGPNAILVLQDRTSSSNSNDIATISYTNDVLSIGGTLGGVSYTNNIGQHEFYTQNGTSSRLGTIANRWGRTFTGGLNTGISTRTANHTMTDIEMTTRANAASGAITITLPTPAAANNGHIFVIVKVDSSANAVTIGATVNGVANPTLTTQWQRMVVQSDGSTYTQIA